MKGYVADIEKLTEENQNFRHVLYTGHNLQLVLMALNPGEDIGMEVHNGHDQFFRVEEGQGQVEIDGTATAVSAGDAFIVPAGAKHNVTNIGENPFKIYTLYAPPEHKDQVVAATKAQAEANPVKFDGGMTE